MSINDGNAALTSLFNLSIFSGCFSKKYVIPLNSVAVVSVPAPINNPALLYISEGCSRLLSSSPSLYFKMYVQISGRSVFLTSRLSTLAIEFAICFFRISWVFFGITYLIKAIIGGHCRRSEERTTSLKLAKKARTQGVYSLFSRRCRGSPKVRSAMISNVVN